MKESQARELLKKYREGTLTEAEKALLESWYLSMAKTQRADLPDANLEKYLDTIWEALPVPKQPEEKSVIKLWPKWLAAASVLLAVLAATYWLYEQALTNHLPDEQIATHIDAPPGDNRAILTLANGEQIELESAENGELAREKNAAILKTKEGEIIYQQYGQPGTSTPAPHAAVVYNTISTPKAGQYKVKLPDGTLVWLNAASSIRFPTVFSEQERVVEIKGEVYFEVAKVTQGKRRVPFKVLTGTQTVEVLGTQFNVNSYADEGSIRTTLLEGSIKVEVAGDRPEGWLLKPGQQALLAYGTSKPSVHVRQVDTRSVMAWKEGYFRFDNVDLPELMRQLSRWYDVEVDYAGPIKEYEFVGQIGRDTPLSKVLQILELGGVHFKLEGKKIIIIE
ncbi:ferric-dicitrate binding protein FerR (iron transport regulator) [Rhabdobacter roseus]|uniref:Ferric-dicitrate binding protein FerR (Iron transport regulator) n=1 Tax=Rhabdobacter roseus TaxID=1655419 RepID=A0A840U6D9_9BACT|nr:FecR family protein [Rhabdobacter roseus]MBB5287389.1 ferric-dicitrate binding protein FerR (iron transport regulator) [Rhabdobacter roseus]